MTIADYLSVCAVSIAVCLSGLFILIWLLRKDGPSFGLPFAYLALLVLNHVPGALVPLLNENFYGHLSEVATGIKLTAIGAICFVFGVWYARRQTVDQKLNPLPPSQLAVFCEDRPFWIFCLLGGWLFTFGLTPLRNLPSVGALIYNGGAIWMLGVLLGLRWSVRNRRRGWTTFWLICLAIYPAMILLTSGFLSYGTTAALIVLCVLAITMREYWRVVFCIVLFAYLGLSLFSNYFQARDNIRDAVWGGASLNQRVDAVSSIFTHWQFFAANDEIALAGLDLRLNQNFFVGLAAENLANGSVKYLNGTSISDALLSLVPRVLWPGKTVFGGSPAIVMKMTGLDLSATTSFGVGNVMEFYINFGLTGLIGGFLALGWALGRFDHRAALAEAQGDYATTLLFFLPGVALIQPIGSMVELTGSASSAWLAAFFWRWAWGRWRERSAGSQLSAAEMTS